jgi:hypothetical protein
MATSTPLRNRATPDAIDALVPPLRRWWIRLAVAVAIVGTVAVAGFVWRFGVVRPAPDCCGEGSSTPSIGLSQHPGAVTITAYFFNSSSHAIAITGADADLPGATLVDVRPYEEPQLYEMPPQNLGAFPSTVGAGGSIWLAVSFEPDRCPAGEAAGDPGDDWGALTLDLEVAGDHWYPTVGRRYRVPTAIAEAGPDHLSVLPPETLGGAFNGTERPLDIACELLGR